MCLMLGSLVYSFMKQATGWVSTFPSRHFQFPVRQRAKKVAWEIGCELGTGWVSSPLSRGEGGRSPS